MGEIVNLMSVDAQRFMDLATYFHLIWSIPLQIVLSIVFLYFTLGLSAFAGVIKITMLRPIDTIVGLIRKKLHVNLIMCLLINVLILANYKISNPQNKYLTTEVFCVFLYCNEC